MNQNLLSRSFNSAVGLKSRLTSFSNYPPTYLGTCITHTLSLHVRIYHSLTLSFSLSLFASILSPSLKFHLLLFSLSLSHYSFSLFISLSLYTIITTIFRFICFEVLSGRQYDLFLNLSMHTYVSIYLSNVYLHLNLSI